MPARGNRGLRVLHRCGKLSLHLLGEFEALGGESCPVNPEVGMFTGRGTAARLDQGAIEGSVAGFVSSACNRAARSRPGHTVELPVAHSASIFSMNSSLTRRGGS